MSKICLTKSELVDLLIFEHDFDRPKATEIIEQYLELIKEGLEKDGKVMLSGFGVFEVKAKPARIGRNPQTGEAMTLRARKVVRFKRSALLRDAVNRVNT